MDDNGIQDAIERLHMLGLLESIMRIQGGGAYSYLLWAPGDMMAEQDILQSVTGEPPKRPVQPRYMKAQTEQKKRTRGHAEVFTPPFIVTKMTDSVAEQNPELNDWRNYVRSTFCEITCGEAPFLTTRYHMGTGEPIPVDKRMGVLDRKFALIREHKKKLSDTECKELTDVAMQTCYGYEYQGDSLLIARINVLQTWCVHWRRLFGRLPDCHWVAIAIETITTNLVQMDGLTGCIPGTEQKVMFMDWAGRQEVSVDDMSTVPA